MSDTKTPSLGLLAGSSRVEPCAGRPLACDVRRSTPADTTVFSVYHLDSRTISSDESIGPIRTRTRSSRSVDT
jgi:hypothetical protein